MKVVRWELKIGFFKGLLLGLRHYYFVGGDDDILEEDVVLYLGMIQIVLTIVKVKE